MRSGATVSPNAVNVRHQTSTWAAFVSTSVPSTSKISASILGPMRLVPVTPGSRARLRISDATPPRSIPHDLDAATKPLLHDLKKLQEMLYAEGKRSVLIVLQGRDAAGKDGTVKHICGA